jgi:hypothetical protein
MIDDWHTCVKNLNVSSRENQAHRLVDGNGGHWQSCGTQGKVCIMLNQYRWILNSKEITNLLFLNSRIYEAKFFSPIVIDFVVRNFPIKFWRQNKFWLFNNTISHQKTPGLTIIIFSSTIFLLALQNGSIKSIYLIHSILIDCFFEYKFHL